MLTPQNHPAKALSSAPRLFESEITGSEGMGGFGRANLNGDQLTELTERIASLGEELTVDLESLEGGREGGLKKIEKAVGHCLPCLAGMGRPLHFTINIFSSFRFPPNNANTLQIISYHIVFFSYISFHEYNTPGFYFI